MSPGPHGSTSTCYAVASGFPGPLLLHLNVRTMELAARVLMNSKFVTGVRGSELDVLQAEVNRLVGVSERYRSREMELSSLSSVVLEMQVLEATSNEISEFDAQRLQNFCEEMSFNLENVAADWCGTYSV